jgi:hypothetical protein
MKSANASVSASSQSLFNCFEKMSRCSYALARRGVGSYRMQLDKVVDGLLVEIQCPDQSLQQAHELAVFISHLLGVGCNVAEPPPQRMAVAPGRHSERVGVRQVLKVASDRVFIVELWG